MKRVRLLVLLLAITMLLSSWCGAAGVDDPVTRKAAKFGSVKVSGTNTVARRALRKSHGKKVKLSAWGLDGALDYVHGMYYMAKLRTSYKAKSADSVKRKVKVKKGQKVVILYYPRRNGKAVCRLKNKRTVYIPVKKLKVLFYIYNSSSAYTDAQIEEYLAEAVRIPLERTENLPEGEQARWDPGENCIYVSSDLTPQQAFPFIAREAACMELAGHQKGREDVLPYAECAAYMLARHYGLEAEPPDLQRITDSFPGMEEKEVRNQLQSAKHAAEIVDARIMEVRQRSRDDREAER